MLTLALILSLLNGNPEATMYPETGIVTQVDYEANTVTFTNCEGISYSFFGCNFSGCEDWHPGDLCSVIMSDNGTQIIFDDIVISARYSGTKKWLPDVYDYPTELLSSGE